MNLPEGENIGKAINDAMKSIEQENRELAGILPQDFTALSSRPSENSRILLTLLKNFNQIPDDIEGDAFGEIYEYFLGEFARAEGQKGGEFFTPSSIVKLLVEIIEPYPERFLTPPADRAACLYSRLASLQDIKRTNVRSWKRSVFTVKKKARTICALQR